MRKLFLTFLIATVLLVTSIAPALAAPRYDTWMGSTWPPVVSGWQVVSSDGSSTLDVKFTDPHVNGDAIGPIADQSSQYPDWNQPNNMDIILYAQNHGYQLPMDSIFGRASTTPGVFYPANDTAVATYTPQILSIIEKSGYTPQDFLNAGANPLPSKSATTPKPTPASVKTVVVATPKSEPTKTVVATTPAPVKKVNVTPAKVVVVTNATVSLAEAKSHSDVLKDPKSPASQALGRLQDQQSNISDQQAQAYNNWRDEKIAISAAICIFLFVLFVLTYLILYRLDWLKKIFRIGRG